MPPVSVDAWAKVNLFLHVTGKRDDGYHLLDSLVVFAGIGDTVAVAPAESLGLTVTGPTAPLLDDLDGDNIVLTAARKLATLCGVQANAHITLTKRLPVAAGIGGGSADAAAALRALMTLWQVSPNTTRLHDLALSLGADVPVCLRGTPTRMFGIGEKLEAAPTLPPAWLVLVNPRIGLSTPAVFKARQGCFRDALPLTNAPRDAADLAVQLRYRANDLAAAAQSLVPEITQALDLLNNTPNCLLARMSGSGATCFGLYADPASAQAAASQILSHRPGWWCHAAPMLSTP
ncbi:4-(cytidine 5'-diphospho)-2-C-methyl-D-erythritol kinase [Magnetospirillum sp. 64-120]|uniref:4-(cytidine 5'-diphospho)-2-C-methyl-D-erythritol kinase n=1 Tax=Magnetospirillum sp. 64-120 TaxID=1895778 RepID=UPI00092BB0F7|nr:4-(cytidine 5'-diphospho)-2-C-methyl-D-erythritol kinase [Magnetospirillum sp. 64-120]OJX70241.1 MAG: 4-(cytidine 5'-diphospho)-2-C-methyl-D-erythritol kinase [Magnetospirillum sp. 64-120]